MSLKWITFGSISLLMLLSQSLSPMVNSLVIRKHNLISLSLSPKLGHKKSNIYGGCVWEDRGITCLSKMKYQSILPTIRGNHLSLMSAAVSSIEDKSSTTIATGSENRKNAESTVAVKGSPTRFIPEQKQAQIDLELLLNDKDIKQRSFNATVISVRKYGVNIKLDDFQVSGILPASCLSDFDPHEGLTTAYCPGKKITVVVSNITSDKRIVFGINATLSGYATLASYPRTKWVIGVITQVSRLGLVVRVANTPVEGMVRVPNIPTELLTILRKRTAAANKTKSVVGSLNNKKAPIVSEIERLFHVKDVIRCRVKAVSLSNQKVDLTMLPSTASDEDSDDTSSAVEDSTIYLHMHRNYTSRDKELAALDQARNARVKQLQQQQLQQQQHQQRSAISSRSGQGSVQPIIWWNGAPFEPVIDEKLTRPDRFEREVLDANELSSLEESDEYVRGKWVRELESLSPPVKPKSKSKEAFHKDIDEQIGGLMGIHEALRDPLQLGLGGININRFGYHLDADEARQIAGLDEEGNSIVRQQDEQQVSEEQEDTNYQNNQDIKNFYDELDLAARKQEKILRGGIKGDLSRLHALIAGFDIKKELRLNRAKSPKSIDTNKTDTNSTNSTNSSNSTNFTDSTD